MTETPARASRFLVVVAPDLAAQFHPKLNPGVELEVVRAGSDKKLWWLGACGHDWDASPAKRVSGQGCPYCAGKRILVGFNDLATRFPAVAAEWHTERNGELLSTAVTQNSGTRIWWIDSFGHEWEASVNNRTHDTGCPYCSNTRVLPGFNDPRTRFPELAVEWHPSRNDRSPSEVAPTSGSKAWWICPKGHEWRATIGNRAYGNGCPVCKVPRGEEFAAEKRRRRAEGRPVKKRAADPTRVSQALVPGQNDMATTHPAPAAEFDLVKNAPFIPSTVVAGTGRRLWWRCLKGHEWAATGNSRTSNGTGCPICAGQRILDGFNDLATLRPDIAAEWHPTRNSGRSASDVTVSNGTKAWWLGTCGHEWEAAVSSRTGQGSGCPTCANQRTLPGFNDLATLQPGVAATWHPTKNGDLTPQVNQYSNISRWWLCDFGHEWRSTVNNRSHGQACPFCTEGGGFNPGRPGLVYFLRHRELAAFKVGITNTGTNRLDKFRATGWEVLNLEPFEDGRHAAAVEGAIKRWWRVERGLPMWLGPKDMPRTGGWTETVSSDELTAKECVDRIRSEAALVRQLVGLESHTATPVSNPA